MENAIWFFYYVWFFQKKNFSLFTIVSFVSGKYNLATTSTTYFRIVFLRYEVDISYHIVLNLHYLFPYCLP